MKARDVMVSPVITLKEADTVKAAAALFLERRISGAPVVDEDRRVVGVISESDLLHRVEAGTERQRSWWLRPFVGSEDLAADYVRSHATRVADVMSRHVIAAEPDTPLHEIARLMETNSIKRIPIVKNGRLAGIVSRANLIQAVAGAPTGLAVTRSDEAVRTELLRRLQAERWAGSLLLNATVRDGVVDLWGSVDSNSQREAARVLAESVQGVRRVVNNIALRAVLPGI